jgi:Outer membrane protein beta-barrel domain
MHTKRPGAAALVFAIVVLGVGVPSLAEAQERRGFWIGAGIGLGSVEASAGDVDHDRDGITVLDIAMGWTLSPPLLIGVELNAFSGTFTRPGAFQDGVVSDLTVTVAYYPRTSSGFFVKGGVGPSFASDLEDPPAAFDVAGTGVAAMIGAGYDVYLGRNFSLTSAVDFRFGRIGDIKFDRQSALDDWSHNVIDFTVGIKFN